MTRQDPQKTTGQIPTEPPGPCVCGDPHGVHALIKGQPSSVRGACTRWGYRRRCGCTGYVPADQEGDTGG